MEKTLKKNQLSLFLYIWLEYVQMNHTTKITSIITGANIIPKLQHKINYFNFENLCNLLFKCLEYNYKVKQDLLCI